MISVSHLVLDLDILILEKANTVKLIAHFQNSISFLALGSCYMKNIHAVYEDRLFRSKSEYCVFGIKYSYGK